MALLHIFERVQCPCSWCAGLPPSAHGVLCTTQSLKSTVMWLRRKQTVIFLVCFLGWFVKPTCSHAGAQRVCLSWAVLIGSEQSWRKKVSSNREWIDTELYWRKTKQNIWVGMIHMFSGLDLKTGLKSPEDFEMTKGTNVLPRVTQGCRVRQEHFLHGEKWQEVPLT